MTPRQEGGRIVLSRELKPGESCEVVLKVPYIALDTSDELAKLAALDFEACERDGMAFWQAELKARGTGQNSGAPPEPVALCSFGPCPDCRHSHARPAGVDQYQRWAPQSMPITATKHA